MPNQLFLRIGYCDMNLKILVLLLLLPYNLFFNGSKKLEFEPVRNVVMNIHLKTMIVKATTSMGEAFLFKNSYLKKLSLFRSLCTISIGDIIDEEAIREKAFHCSMADFNCHLL